MTGITKELKENEKEKDKVKIPNYSIKINNLLYKIEADCYLPLYYKYPATVFCGITLTKEKIVRKTLLNILWIPMEQPVYKAVFFIDDTENVLWDVLTNYKFIDEHYKQRRYNIFTSYDILQKFSGNKITIHMYTKNEKEDNYYLHVYSFDRNYEVISAYSLGLKQEST